MNKLSITLLSLAMTVCAFGQGYKEGDKLFTIGIGNSGSNPGTLWWDELEDNIDENYAVQSSHRVLRNPYSIGLGFQQGFHEFISLGGYITPAFSKAEMSGYHRNYHNNSGNWDNDDFKDDEKTITYYQKRKRTTVYYGIRAEAHVAELIEVLPPNLDLYLGISLGSSWRTERVYDQVRTETVIYNVDENDEYTQSNPVEYDNGRWNPGSGGVGFNVNFGARYFFTDSMGAFVDFGVIDFYSQVGLALKLQ